MPITGKTERNELFPTWVAFFYFAFLLILSENRLSKKITGWGKNTKKNKG
jgi:hypothetical protein